MDALGILFYFAKQYYSWERRSNENTNELIRQYLSKGTDFAYTYARGYFAIQDKQ